MKIHTFYSETYSNNYYLLSDDNYDFYAIDPWDANVISNYILKNKKGKLKAILITHNHADHIRGIDKLVKTWNDVQILNYQTLKNQKNIIINSKDTFEILRLGGHTIDGLGFLYKKNNKQISLFSGDTLFTAGVGNCKNGGDISSLYESIQFLNDYILGDVTLYSGHQYLQKNLRFYLNIEDKNVEILKFQNMILQNAPHLQQIFLKMIDVKKINIFLKAKNFIEFKKLREARDIF